MRMAKTRESLRSIKAVDKAEGLAKKSKNGTSSLANAAEETQNSRHETEVEYAGNEVQDKEERSGRAFVRGAARVGQWGYRTTVRNIQRWRNRPRKIELKVDVPKQLPPPQRPMLTEGVKGGVKTASKGIKNGSKAAKNASKASAKAAKKAAKAAKTDSKTAPKSLALTIRNLYSDSGRLLASAFSACANDKSGFSVRLRRLGTVGICPFQFNECSSKAI